MLWLGSFIPSQMQRKTNQLGWKPIHSPGLYRLPCINIHQQQTVHLELVENTPTLMFSTWYVSCIEFYQPHDTPFSPIQTWTHKYTQPSLTLPCLMTFLTASDTMFEWYSRLKEKNPHTSIITKTGQKFRIINTVLNDFERSLLCSQRLHLFDQKCS